MSSLQTWGCAGRSLEGDDGDEVDLDELLAFNVSVPDGGMEHSLRLPVSYVSGYDGRTHVVVLGSGTPAADPDRAGPGVAVVVGGHSYLVDSGAGVVRRAAEARSLGVEALEPKRLRRVFLTHLHSDHTVGLPDLWLSPWVLGRRNPLEVYGPEGTFEMVQHLRKAYRRDVHVRRSGPNPANPHGHRIVATDIYPGLVYEDRNVRVFAFPVRHGRWKHAYGYRFETDDRVVVVSGDTAPTESIVENCRGCDVLVHEVYSGLGAQSLAPSRRVYHRASHTSGYELAEIANRARPGLLVLYHQLLWGVGESSLLAEIASIYSGPVVSARDLDIF